MLEEIYNLIPMNEIETQFFINELPSSMIIEQKEGKVFINNKWVICKTEFGDTFDLFNKDNNSFNPVAIGCPKEEILELANRKIK